MPGQDQVADRRFSQVFRYRRLRRGYRKAMLSKAIYKNDGCSQNKNEVFGLVARCSRLAKPSRRNRRSMEAIWAVWQHRQLLQV